jgi:hypothetical protein
MIGDVDSAIVIILFAASMILAGIADWRHREVPMVLWFPGAIGLIILALADGAFWSSQEAGSLVYITYSVVVGAIVGVVYYFVTRGALGAADAIAFVFTIPFLLVSWIAFIVGLAIIYVLVRRDAGATLQKEVQIDPNSPSATKYIPTRIVFPDGKSVMLSKNLKLAWQAAKNAPQGATIYGKYAVPIVTLLAGGAIVSFIVVIAAAISIAL